ncbi:hypothetical protein ASE91_04415 [Sphingomonas sp. Leaf62]|nr:hypothetical protein ASE91_04415 [Sphingomonas sp. Leaf62]
MRAAIVARYDGAAGLGKGTTGLLLSKGTLCECGVILRFAAGSSQLMHQSSPPRRLGRPGVTCALWQEPLMASVMDPGLRRDDDWGCRNDDWGLGQG